MKSMEELACEMVRLNARYRTGDSSAMEGIRALAWTAEVPVDFVVTLLDSDGTEEEIVIEMQSEIQSLRMKN